MKSNFRKTALLATTLITTLTSIPVYATFQSCNADSQAHNIAAGFENQRRDAITKGSVDRISSLYADSAVIMPPSDQTIVGANPISNFLALNPQLGAIKLEMVSCEQVGQTLHIAGVWGRGTRNDGAGGTWETGNLMRVLETDAQGDWVARYEIWN